MQNCASGIKVYDHIVYTDQNNNQFHIKFPDLSYRAIQPTESSSGTYSGGTNFKAQLTGDDYTAINNLLQALVEDKAFHIEKRTKTSAVIEVRRQDQSTKTMVLPSSKRQELENLLHSFR